MAKGKTANCVDSLGNKPNVLDAVQAAGVGLERRGGADHLVQRDHEENEIELLTRDRTKRGDVTGTFW